MLPANALSVLAVTTMSSEQMHDASDQTRRFGAEKTEQAQENAQNARGLGLATSAAAQTADDKATGCKSKSNAADDALQQTAEMEEENLNNAKFAVTRNK